MVTYVTWKGQRVTPWMAYQLNRLDHDIKNAFGVTIGSTSAIRLPQEQLDIWYDRYVTAGNVRGRYVYDTRWWNGQLWYRISSAGTVAQPGTSNHEIQGNSAAADLYDSGSDPGITSRWSVRGQWIRRNAWRYDMEAEGDNFAEGWHFKFNNIFNTPPGKAAGGSSEPEKETEDMDFINIQGKENVRKAGVFAIYRGNADGKLYARRITTNTTIPSLPTFGDEGLANLQKAMPFLDL